MNDWRVALTDIAMPEQDVRAVLDCLESGWLTMGPRTQAFEAALADWVGAPHAVAVSSGTAALHLACLAAGIGAGDEVIVPAFTFVASASASRYVGAEPVLCDVRSPQDFNIDPEDAARRITSRTKAIVAVHFCGYPADVLALRALCDEHGLALIEDCAQAIGARVDDTGRQAGTVGERGAFSFFSKQQLCVGEGGMVTTGDEQRAERVRLLRSHALTSSTSGAPSRPRPGLRRDRCRLQLPPGRAPRGPRAQPPATAGESIAARRAIVGSYRERLAEVPGIELAFTEQAVERGSHFAFPVLLADRATRDRFRDERESQRHPDDVVSGIAHLHRVSPLRAARRASDSDGGG